MAAGTRGSWSHSIHNQAAERDGCWCLAHLLLFSLGPQSRDNIAHIPTLAKPSGNAFINTPRSVFPQLSKLTVELNHHSYQRRRFPKLSNDKKAENLQMYSWLVSMTLEHGSQCAEVTFLLEWGFPLKHPHQVAILVTAR